MSHSRLQRLHSDADPDIEPIGDLQVSLRKRPRNDEALCQVAPSDRCSLFMTAEKHWARLPADCKARVAEQMQKGVGLISDYSGWGTVETAAKHVEKVVRKHSQKI